MTFAKTARENYGDLVAAYALRLHAAAGDRHHVVSPLGAWLLVALTAPLASGSDRERLERVLGCDAETARRAADELLENPHPALALAFATWHRGDIGAGLDAWRWALPPCATTSSMPTQAEANAWACEQTRGQIESMPVEINDDSRLLLATAVATEVPWERAFELVSAAELGGPWATRVKRVMRRHQKGSVQVVARTEAAGFVGVSRECSRGGLDVISVIAAPDVQAARVIAAAYEVAACFARLPSTAAFVNAFDLPATSHAWVVRERVLENFSGPERIERSEVTIPAWTAGTELGDLIAAPGTGFAEIASAILGQLPPDPRGDRANATQVARARFDTNGFSAAAVTVLHIIGAMRPTPRRAIERTVEVRFDRPFAVVAATNTDRFSRQGVVLWRGMPAFGAWVTEPMEPSEPDGTEEDWLSNLRKES